MALDWCIRCRLRICTIVAKSINQTMVSCTPVHFFSRSLQGPESRYDVRDKELLSVIASLKSMHHLLQGVPFKVLTDQRSLQHLHSTKLHTSQRHVRWLEYMQQFQFEPIYVPGKTNCMADLLSRHPIWYEHFEGSLTPGQVNSSDVPYPIQTSPQISALSLFAIGNSCCYTLSLLCPCGCWLVACWSVATHLTITTTTSGSKHHYGNFADYCWWTADCA